MCGLHLVMTTGYSLGTSPGFAGGRSGGVQIGWYGMARARELYERVREAQAMLGTGEVEEAVARAEALRTEALTRLEGRVPSGAGASFALLIFGSPTSTLIWDLARPRPRGNSSPRYGSWP